MSEHGAGFDRLIVFGGGVMGRAIVEGGIRAHALEARRVVIAEPDEARRAAMASLGCGVAATGRDAFALASLSEGMPSGAAILLAVKPQMFAAVADEIRSSRKEIGDGSSGAAEARAGTGPLVVSIMAGVRAATILDRLGGGVRVVRAMPNTPARVGQGVTGIAPGPSARESDVASAERLFASLGPVVVRLDESLMDAFTALAGSGPAYAFFLAEAMERAGVEIGFDGPTARRIVAQTLRGAAALLDGTDPAELRAAVTSKGGTTAAAVGVLEREGVASTWVRAILSARDRGRELARD